MAEKRFDVAVRVISQEGVCMAKHRVGEEWVLGRRSPQGICLTALHAIYPNVKVLMYGGSFPFAPDPETSLVPCPDPKNRVVFELRRIRKQAEDKK